MLADVQSPKYKQHTAGKKVGSKTGEMQKLKTKLNTNQFNTGTQSANRGDKREAQTNQRRVGEDRKRRVKHDTLGYNLQDKTGNYQTKNPNHDKRFKSSIDS